jgi:hypothetical protein
MKPCWPGNTHTHTGSGSTQVGFVHLLLRLPKQKARSSILEVLCHLHRNHGWPLGLVGRHVLTHANLHAPLANMIHKLKTSRAIDSCDLATRNMRAPLDTRSGLHRRLQLDPARLQTLSPPSPFLIIFPICWRATASATTAILRRKSSLTLCRHAPRVTKLHCSSHRSLDRVARYSLGCLID